MLYEYAIEPDVLHSWDKCRLTLNLMGFQHGRAIAAYPSWKRWKKMVFEACSRNPGCGEVEFQRIYEKVLESEDEFVRSLPAGDYDDSILPAEQRWVRNAVARQNSGAAAFRAIVATQNPESHPDVVLERDVDESHPKLDVPREVPVPREPRALADHVGTLVRNSRELLLIDPHFDPEKPKWRSVVRACIATAGRAVSGDARVEIHARDADGKPSPELFERACRKWIPGILPAYVESVRVCRWRIRDDGPHDFHARYVLTDRGGYRLDKGLDEEHGVTQPVALLAEQEWRRVREGFRGGNSFFDKTGEFRVTAGGSVGPRSAG